MLSPVSRPNIILLSLRIQPLLRVRGLLHTRFYTSMFCFSLVWCPCHAAVLFVWRLQHRYLTQKHFDEIRRRKERIYKCLLCSLGKVAHPLVLELRAGTRFKCMAGVVQKRRCCAWEGRRPSAGHSEMNTSKVYHPLSSRSLVLQLLLRGSVAVKWCKPPVPQVVSVLPCLEQTKSIICESECVFLT